MIKLQVGDKLIRKDDLYCYIVTEVIGDRFKLMNDLEDPKHRGRGTTWPDLYSFTNHQPQFGYLCIENWTIDYSYRKKQLFNRQLKEL
jgi:hypothetical protein